MAKKATTTSPPLASTLDEQKKRKQVARCEAKLMLEIEKTKTNLQKAERKRAKARALLEANTAHLRTLETGLSELRTSHEKSNVNASDTGFDQQSRQPELEEITPGSNQQNSATSH